MHTNQVSLHMGLFSSHGIVRKYVIIAALLLFDDSKIKMVRKPGKKQKENRVGRTGENQSVGC